MEFVKSVLKGMVIGIANIIPGVSGGTMMVAMGIYDKLIHCITHLFSELKKNIIFLMPIVIGMLLAIVGSSLVLETLFERFPIQTNLLFVGLILGGLPAVWKKVKGNTIKAGFLVPMLLFFALVVGLAMLGEGEGTAADLSMSLINIVKLFGIGIVASATMVIPGVSGSMMLMLLGYYKPILSAISNTVHGLTAFDIPGVVQSCAPLIPFGIGVVVGIFAIAKIVEILFEKFPMYCYFAIIGLILASPVAIVVLGDLPAIGVVSAVTGLICLVMGFAAAMKLGE